MIKAPKTRHAYTAIVEANGYIIGRADEGTHGYTPIYEAGKFTTYEAAKTAARAMNESAGIDANEAALLVLTTL